jgi:hypothetical protein
MTCIYELAERVSRAVLEAYERGQRVAIYVISAREYSDVLESLPVSIQPDKPDDGLVMTTPVGEVLLLPSVWVRWQGRRLPEDINLVAYWQREALSARAELGRLKAQQAREGGKGKASEGLEKGMPVKSCQDGMRDGDRTEVDCDRR